MSTQHRSCRIAHLSDLHVLASRDSRAAAHHHPWRTRFVSFGRPLDAEERARKASRAIAHAKQQGATHFVFSGDLTELGTPREFEAFAEIVHAARIEPDRITLVPGKDDAYSAPDAWRRALDERLGSCRDRAAVVVHHHPPIPHASRAWQWIDGLRGHARLCEIVARHEHVHVMHGHLHHAVDAAIGPDGRTRVFGATATVDDAVGAPRVRIYDVRDGAVVAVRHAEPVASARSAA